MGSREPTVSRLARSNAAEFRTLQQIVDFCDQNLPPEPDGSKAYWLPDKDLIAKTPETKEAFDKSYKLAPLPPTTLKEKGVSTIMVIEPKMQVPVTFDGSTVSVTSNHGEVGTVLSYQVGNSLAGGDDINPKVDAIYIKTSVNPSWRAKYDKARLEPVTRLINNQGVAVINNSAGWADDFLTYKKLEEEQLSHLTDKSTALPSHEQAEQLWQVTAFLVDSAGNYGKKGDNGEWSFWAQQKHNALSHLAPLVVHVGAVAQAEDGKWNIEGYSAANSPTLLAPVFPKTMLNINEDVLPEAAIGTSLAANYVSGALAALNSRYGSYLTREQILYAVIATCDHDATHVNSFTYKTPKPTDIKYKPNAAGIMYNPEYGGAGVIDVIKADKLLGHMVNLTQDKMGSISTPIQNLVRQHDCEDHHMENDGLYHYKIKMPKGVALKTTIQAEFQGEDNDVNFGGITITSPSGTTIPMVMSRLNVQDKRIPPFGMSTSHGWAGEQLEGIWEVTSKSPLKNLCMMQDHFQEHDIVAELNSSRIKQLLSTEVPDLSNAAPLNPNRLHAEQKIREFPERHAILRELPPFFSKHRQKFGGYNASQWEIEATSILSSIGRQGVDNDRVRERAARLQIHAAKQYAKAGQELQQIIPLDNAAFNYLACDEPHDTWGKLNAENAIECSKEAIRLSVKNGCYGKAYEASRQLYTAISRCCAMGYEEQYGSQLEEVRKDALRYSQLMQGGVDETAHRIEKGEYGFSATDKIGSDDINHGVTIIAQDPVTKKTGLVHLNHHDDFTSLDKFFDEFGGKPVNVRLVGARHDTSFDMRSRNNVAETIKYIKDHQPSAKFISADVFGGEDAPSAVVVDPQTFNLEEKVPNKKTPHEAISKLSRLTSPHNGQLIKQFDLTTGYTRPEGEQPSIVQQFAGKKEWEIERMLEEQGIQERPLIVDHITELQKSIEGSLQHGDPVLSTQIAAKKSLGM